MHIEPSECALGIRFDHGALATASADPRRPLNPCDTECIAEGEADPLFVRRMFQSAVPVEPSAIRGQEGRSFAAFADGQVHGRANDQLQVRPARWISLPSISRGTVPVLGERAWKTCR